MAAAAFIDRLLDEAKTYELNAAAAKDRGEEIAAMVFNGVAIALSEVAIAARETFALELDEAA